jgi:serine/threonine protein kinase
MCCCGKCDSQVDLGQFGIDASGCIRDASWLASIKVPCKQSLLNPALFYEIPSRQICQIKTVASGSFGSIDIASRSDDKVKSIVYVKKPRIIGRSLLYEALIQDKVQRTLFKGGFPTGAPRVLDIFKLHDGSVCFTMEMIEAVETLQEVLEKATTAEVTHVLVEAILQVSAMLWYLETEIGMNHRDLKPSNLLIRKHEPKVRSLKIGDKVLEIISTFTLTFIDFGFSCIGSNETQKSDIAIGKAYHPSDPCPKEGRDLYSFLAFIYAEHWSKLPLDLRALFEKWLAVPGTKLLEVLRRYKSDAKDHIYFIIGNIDIKKFDCCPCKIVGDIEAFGSAGKAGGSGH